MWWRSHEFDGFDFSWLNATIQLRFIQCNCYRFRANGLLQTVKWQMLRRDDRNRCRWFAAIGMCGRLNFHSKSFEYNCDAHSNTLVTRLNSMCITHVYGTQFILRFRRFRRFIRCKRLFDALFNSNTGLFFVEFINSFCRIIHYIQIIRQTLFICSLHWD